MNSFIYCFYMVEKSADKEFTTFWICLKLGTVFTSCFLFAILFDDLNDGLQSGISGSHTTGTNTHTRSRSHKSWNDLFVNKTINSGSTRQKRYHRTHTTPHAPMWCIRLGCRHVYVCALACVCMSQSWHYTLTPHIISNSISNYSECVCIRTIPFGYNSRASAVYVLAS